MSVTTDSIAEGLWKRERDAIIEVLLHNKLGDTAYTRADRTVAALARLAPQGAAPRAEGLDGANRITAERQRQIEVEGHDPINDANDHDPQDMEQAALAYLLDDPDRWPWANSPKYGPTRVRELEKAGALIAAAIDIRLHWASLSRPSDERVAKSEDSDG